jgi:hypothetical protein
MDRMFWLHFALNHPLIELAGLLGVIAVYLGINWWSER